MARQTRTHLPEDEYLLLVGQLAYMVSSIEGLIVFDLPGMAAYLPEGLNAGGLAGKTTGQIAGALTAAVAFIEDGDVRAYIDVAGCVLSQASLIRNDVVHARPATVDGKTCLNRWKLSDKRGPHLAFPITEDWLKEKIDMLSEFSVRMNEVRCLHKNAAFTEEPSD